jgi:hypothetical protein
LSFLFILQMLPLLKKISAIFFIFHRQGELCMRTSDRKKGLQQMPNASLVGMARPASMLLVWMVLFAATADTVSIQAAETGRPVTVNCDVQNTACRQEISGTEVTFDINPKPVRAMTDLRFRITLTGEQPKALPYIDLGMPGMKMGPNQVFMKTIGAGVYEGVGIIVRCPSGKKIWKAAVALPGIGIAEFVFDVIY